MNEMKNIAQRVVALPQRREYLVVDRPVLDNVTAGEEEIQVLVRQYNLTVREAEIIWLLRNHVPIDLSLIPAARTHIHAMRKKLIGHNVEIKNLWRGVYQLSIVGD